MTRKRVGSLWVAALMVGLGLLPFSPGQAKEDQKKNVLLLIRDIRQFSHAVEKQLQKANVADEDINLLLANFDSLIGHLKSGLTNPSDTCLALGDLVRFGDQWLEKGLPADGELTLSVFIPVNALLGRILDIAAAEGQSCGFIGAWWYGISR